MMDNWSPWFRLTVSVLATWRVAHLIAHEDGPFDVIVRLRRRAGPSVVGRLMDCPYCLSLWIALPFAFVLGRTPLAWGLGWLAVSGGASLLERVAERHAGSPPFTGA
jgi:hypothetical protein